MSGASAHVLALVRSHYSGDERAFMESALALSRGSRSPVVKNAITDAIRNRPKSPPRQQRGNSKGSLQPLPTPATGGMLEHISDRSLDALVLPDWLRVQLDEVALEIDYREQLDERGLRPRSRLLFTGPPGCGKTSAASGLATRCSMAAYAVSLPRIIEGYVGATSKNIATMFDSLRDGTVIVLDEIDAIGAMRGGADQAAAKEYNGIVNTLLTLLDRRRGGVLVATTNRIDILDAALVRRFDEVMEFPSPTDEQKLELAASLASRHEVDPPPRAMVRECQHFAAVEQLVEREARRAVMREILAGEEEEDGNEED
jgi:hypothetical protein